MTEVPPAVASDADLDKLSVDQMDAMAGRGAEPSPAEPVQPAAAAPEPPATPAEPAKPAEPAAPVASAPSAPSAEPAKPVAAGSDDDDEAPPADGKIPYQKYQRERAKTRDRIAALERQLTETNDKFARGDERAKMLAELVAQVPQEPEAKPAEPQDPEPDPNQDIIAWANWSRRENQRLHQAITQTRESVSQTSDTIRDTAAQQAVRENYQADAVAFARENQDFPLAYNHLLTVRAAMLQEQGHGEQEIRTILRNEERGLVERAFQQNKRPAQLIYGMAKQLGFRPPAPAAPPVAAAPAAALNGNGAAAAPPAAPATPSVTAEIERIAAGQAASKSLTGSGGAPQEISIEALANMSGREFEALYAKKSGEIEALLGKRAH